MNQFYFFFAVEVFGIFIDAVLMNVYHSLATNLKQLLGTIEARKMRHISCKAFRNSTFCSLQNRIDFRMNRPDTVSLDHKTAIL